LDDLAKRTIDNTPPRVRTAEASDDGDYVRVEFEGGGDLVGAETFVSMAAQDKDDIPIQLVVSSRGGRLVEFELVKADGSTILERPDPRAFEKW